MSGKKRCGSSRSGRRIRKGDAIAYLPAERTVFTGDILFVGSHPVMWAGPVGNWIAACERILALDVDIVVPGHGAITDKAGVRETRDYFRWIESEAKHRWQSGMPAETAARAMVRAGYTHWLDRERMAANVRALYRAVRGQEGRAQRARGIRGDGAPSRRAAASLVILASNSSENRFSHHFAMATHMLR